MNKISLALGASLAALAGAVATDANADPTTVSSVTVTGTPTAEATQLPLKTATATREIVAKTVNVMNVEDMVEDLPDILVRKRHIGDTQAPITTRTSGVGASARSLIYADDVLLSALIGNNNGNASPRWAFVSPQEVDHIDILYGPFAAQYPGNSIGEVVNIVTRMPDHLEAGVDAVGAWQNFSEYSTHQNLGSGELSGYVGDKIGPWSFWLSAEHLDTTSQPLAFVTLTQPATTSTAGTPVAGATATLNRLGQPIEVLGAGSIEHQVQDNAKLKVGLDLTPAVTATYSIGVFNNWDQATDQTYLTNAAGGAVFSGAVNIAGRSYSIPASAFSGDVYNFDELHLGQSLKVASHTDGAFDWEVVGSVYSFLNDTQAFPSVALPAATAGGAGTVVDMGGTGWQTLDFKGVWRTPQNELSFGVHGDEFELTENKFNTADWIVASEGSLATAALGKTRTLAAWGQDAWSITSDLTLTVGLRLEDWRAFGGVNASLSPPLVAFQPRLAADRASPKVSLGWTPAPDWKLTASFGEASRFPTVEELYQTVTVGPTLAVPNPHLAPEDANSVELSAERSWTGGNLRVSGFGEWIHNALLSQTAPLTPASTTLVSFTQNVDQTRVLGVEAVAEQANFLVRGLDLNGSVTYADAVTTSDPTFPEAVGRQLTDVPKWRLTGVAAYQATPKLSLSAAVRYSSRVFATINDADIVTHTFEGFDPYLVADLRATYQLTPHVMAAVGVDNANDDNYFVFHAFPQRTLFGELKWKL